jgi:hypothetical protein
LFFQDPYISGKRRHIRQVRQVRHITKLLAFQDRCIGEKKICSNFGFIHEDGQLWGECESDGEFCFYHDKLTFNGDFVTLEEMNRN